MSFLVPKVKGSIPVGTTTGAVPGFTALPVGTDGQILTADSTVDTGVSWKASGTRTIVSTAVSLALTSANDVVLATASPITITMPDPTTVTGRTFTVKKTDAAATAVTIAPFAAETIDGAASINLNSQYESVDLISDGTNWQLI